MSVTCRNRSRYGICRLPAKHDGDHAVPIGDDVWFVYRPRRGGPVGYCVRGADGEWRRL